MLPEPTRLSKNQTPRSTNLAEDLGPSTVYVRVLPWFAGVRDVRRVYFYAAGRRPVFRNPDRGKCRTPKKSLDDGDALLIMIEG
jgi:hypothetical protein